jgi:PAS domain S-box-containing protein
MMNGVNRQLASWLVARRHPIERLMAASLGDATPTAGSPEAETLRRFRTFAAAALRRGDGAKPALDGIRVDEQRATMLLSNWIDAAATAAGPDGAVVREELVPILLRFRVSLRTTQPAREASGPPRSSKRRAVSAAIDRISDAFLAIDVDTGRIADSNPAAGALLGTTRDALLNADTAGFLPEPVRDTWWTHLDAVAEGAEPRRFSSSLADSAGESMEVEVSVSRFAKRRQTLALAVVRPTHRR